MTRISRVRVWDLPLGGQKRVGPMVHGYKSGLDAKDEHYSPAEVCWWLRS